MRLEPHPEDTCLLLQAYRYGEYLGLFQITHGQHLHPMLSAVEKRRLLNQRATCEKKPKQCDGDQSPTLEQINNQLNAYERATLYEAELRPLDQESYRDMQINRAVQEQFNRKRCWNDYNHRQIFCKDFCELPTYTISLVMIQTIWLEFCFLFKTSVYWATANRGGTLCPVPTQSNSA